jgi:hypothetical protein
VIIAFAVFGAANDQADDAHRDRGPDLLSWQCRRSDNGSVNELLSSLGMEGSQASLNSSSAISTREAPWLRKK